DFSVTALRTKTARIPGKKGRGTGGLERCRVGGGGLGRGVDETRSLRATADASAGDGAQPRWAMRARAAWLSDPSPQPSAGYPPARLTASVIARFAKTRQRRDLYSTDPWRSACTSTPSAAFCAAASIAAASSFLPLHPASTPLARTA